MSVFVRYLCYYGYWVIDVNIFCVCIEDHFKEWFLLACTIFYPNSSIYSVYECSGKKYYFIILETQLCFFVDMLFFHRYSVVRQDK